MITQNSVLNFLWKLVTKWSVRMKSKKLCEMEPYKEVGLQHRLAEFVFVLMGDDGENFGAFGSGFFVAPGLVLTAKHVMSEYWNRYHPRRPFPKRKTEADTRFQVLGLQFPNGSAEPRLWYSEKMWISDFTDAAFLYMKPYDEDAKKYEPNIWYELNMRNPESGKCLVAFGYPGSKVELIKRNPNSVEYELSFSRSIGPVGDIYERLRERGSLKFPSFQIKANYPNGMSGGPVINQGGQVCGLVCYGSGDVKTGYDSYATLLWPAMLTQLDIDLRTGELSSPYFVYELFEDNFIKQTGWDDVFKEKSAEFEIIENDDGEWELEWIEKS